ALALIQIAHPECREALLTAAKQLNYVSPTQEGHSLTTPYPIDWECSHTTKKGRSLFVRPIQAIDEDALRDFFHQQSNDSVYLRYFSHLSSLPQKVLKSTSDIDYTQDMAFVALYPVNGAIQEIAAIAQYFSNAYNDAPEIAIQVRDDWQGHGLGKFMFHQLVKVAKCRQFTALKADTLRENKAMNHVFSNAGYPYQRQSEFGVHTYIFDIQ
ncbi:MAG: GNAT family N-acetyltransferase, partial [Pseudomonadota bacterium]